MFSRAQYNILTLHVLFPTQARQRRRAEQWKAIAQTSRTNVDVLELVLVWVSRTRARKHSFYVILRDARALRWTSASAPRSAPAGCRR